MSEDIINNRYSLDAHINRLRADFETHKYLRVSVKTGKQRTDTQNRALHLFFTQLAKTLNDGGLDFRLTIKEDVDVPWTPELVKEYMWRPIQKTLTGQQSTTKPEREMYGMIYEVLSRHLSEKLNVYVPWPCKENM